MRFCKYRLTFDLQHPDTKPQWLGLCPSESIKANVTVGMVRAPSQLRQDVILHDSLP